MTVSEKYGPWGVVAGGSDGVGIAFAHGLAARGLNVVLVARRESVLASAAEELRAKHDVQVRTVALDLTSPDAIADLEAATADVEVGLFVYNAGGDDISVPFLDKPLDSHLSLVKRNTISVLEASYRFGGKMVERGRGGIILVTSGAAWVGGATLATYGATKAFDLLLAESLWAEWRDRGVDVLALVLGATNTPSLMRVLDASGRPHDALGTLAEPDDVAEEGLTHLADGPTWIIGGEPNPGSPFGPMPRRDAVLLMSGSWHHDS